MRTPAFTLKAFWPFGCLLIVVIGLYGQSLGFGYIWDDGALFVDNTMLRERAWSWAAVARPILPDTPYFRPLVLTTWMAEMQLFKLNPLYSHAINTLLHGINACLVYVIAWRLFNLREDARMAAFFAALVFAVHPCLVEGVAWISGRFDLLATSFLLMGLATAMAPATTIRCLFVGLFALSAMLSKETGVLFAPLLLLLGVARHPTHALRAVVSSIWPYLAAYIVAVVLYFTLRSQALGFASYSGFGWMQLVSAFQNYEFWVRALSFYTFMSFMPFSSISPQHDMLLELESARQNVIALAAALGILIAVLWFSIKRHAWAVVWLGFYVSIFPVLGILSIKLGDTIGAERFLYLPLSMLAIALAAFFLAIRDKYPEKGIITFVGVGFVGGWLALSVLVTYTVTSMWENGVKLWSWQYQTRADNRMVLINYLVQLSNSRQPELETQFEVEIEKIQSRNGGSLPMEVQIVYATYLLMKNDPEALPYLQGLVENSKIWNKRGEELGGMNSAMYSGVLANYAQAVMIFNGDLELARRTLERARAITMRGSEFQIVHPMIALEYLDGHKNVALEMYRNNLDVLHAYDIHKMHASIRTLVEYTCLQLKDEDCKAKASEFLEDLKKEGSVTSR